MIFHFLAGLPRSGSTVLGAILAQSPEVHVSATSSLAHHGPMPVVEATRLYRHVDRSVVVDKNRGWASRAGLAVASMAARGNPKVLFPHRPVDEILASYRRVVDASPIMPLMVLEQRQRGFSSIEDYLLSPYGNVGQALGYLADARASGADRHFLRIDYDDLVSRPHEQIERVREFLGLSPWLPDLKNLRNPSPENDLALYALPGLHDIRPALEKRIYQ